MAPNGPGPEVRALREKQRELEARIEFIENKLGILQREHEERDEIDKREGRDPYVPT